MNYLEILKDREVELVRDLGEKSGVAIEVTADFLDNTREASNRDLRIADLDRKSKELRQVRAAQQRIHDGSFGRCLGCDEHINPRRLAIIAWAEYCTKCQEARENGVRIEDKEEDFGLMPVYI